MALAASANVRPLSLRRLMPAPGTPIFKWRISRNTGVMLAVFLVAAIVCVAVTAFRSNRSEPARPATARQAQTAHVDALVKEILDRPLFSSDRSPAPEPPSPEELAALRPPVLKSHLTGITILPDARLAHFVGDGNKYVSLKEGDDIDGFKVRAIAADQVILASSFGQQIVRPAKGTYETVRNTKPVELGNFDPDKN
jgi:hypothetical protein